MTYTNEQLRKIDALVAEHVMDLDGPYYDESVHDSEPYFGTYALASRYSTDIAAAWEVVEKMRHEIALIPMGRTRWMATSNRSKTAMSDWYGPVADTAPLAICLAALKSKNIEVNFDSND